MTCALLAFCLAFHAADVRAQWRPRTHPSGWWQEITSPDGKVPATVLSALTYDDQTGVWEIWEPYQFEGRGMWGRTEEILRDGEIIDYDEQGNVAVEWLSSLRWSQTIKMISQTTPTATNQVHAFNFQTSPVRCAFKQSTIDLSAESSIKKRELRTLLP